MTPDEEAPSKSSLTRSLGIALFAAAFCLAVIFPGDLPFHDDECSLISNALAANAQGRLTSLGLGGTYGYGYGPLPTQFYQIVLPFTHELRAVVVIRAILFILVMSGAMWSIGNSLALPQFMIGAFLCTPWIWFFCRLPWDNTFNLPLGLLATAAYLRWFEAPTRANAIGCAMSAVAMPLVHLSAAAVPLALTLHAVAMRFSQFRKFLGWIVLGAVLACSTSVPYLWQTADQVMQKVSLRIAGYPSESTRAQPPRLQSVALALSASWLLTGEQRFFTEWRAANVGRAIAALKPLTWSAHLWMAVGASVGIASVLQRKRDLRVAAVLLAFMMIAVFAVIFAVMRVKFFAHYLGGALPAATLLCWIGVDWLWRSAWMRNLFVVIPCITIAVTTSLLAVAIHKTNGGNSLFSPTLGNLISLARELHGSPHATAWTDSPQLASSPAQLRLIRSIYGPADATARSTDHLVIRRRNAFPGDGWVIVTRAEFPPKDFVEIQIRN